MPSEKTIGERGPTPMASNCRVPGCGHESSVDCAMSLEEQTVRDLRARVAALEAERDRLHNAGVACLAELSRQGTDTLHGIAATNAMRHALNASSAATRGEGDAK